MTLRDFHASRGESIYHVNCHVWRVLVVLSPGEVKPVTLLFSVPIGISTDPLHHYRLQALMNIHEANKVLSKKVRLCSLADDLSKAKELVIKHQLPWSYIKLEDKKLCVFCEEIVAEDLAVNADIRQAQQRWMLATSSSAMPRSRSRR
jgi:hypothetical protein